MFPLEEVNKHQPVEHHGCIPAAVSIVVDSFDVFEERDVFLLKLGVELFGYALDIEGLLQALRYIDDWQATALIKLAYVYDHRAELRKKQIAGLSQIGRASCRERG